jgi:nucleotide-binding universal stress UspA family protein
VYEKLLLAVDGSEHSREAVAAATELARAFKSDVLVFHVREREFIGRGSYDVETTAQAQKAVDEAVRQVEGAGVKARGQLVNAEIGHVPKEILAAAKGFDAGLIVMGSRGLSDLEGLLVGSVTHKVVHLGDCPVLVVR